MQHIEQTNPHHDWLKRNEFTEIIVGPKANPKRPNKWLHKASQVAVYEIETGSGNAFIARSSHSRFTWTRRVVSYDNPYSAIESLKINISDWAAMYRSREERISHLLQASKENLQGDTVYLEGEKWLLANDFVPKRDTKQWNKELREEAYGVSDHPKSLNCQVWYTSGCFHAKVNYQGTPKSDKDLEVAVTEALKRYVGIIGDTYNTQRDLALRFIVKK